MNFIVGLDNGIVNLYKPLLYPVEFLIVKHWPGVHSETCQCGWGLPGIGPQCGDAQTANHRGSSEPGSFGFNFDRNITEFCVRLIDSNQMMRFTVVMVCLFFLLHTEKKTLFRKNRLWRAGECRYSWEDKIREASGLVASASERRFAMDA